MTEDDLSTVLETGEEIPVRRVGELYVVAYDHLPVEEFLHYIDLLLTDEGIENEYTEDDVAWVDGVFIDFGDNDGLPRVQFGMDSHPDAISATVLECW